MPFNVAILTVSDTACKDPSQDRSGPLIRSLFETHDSDLFRIAGKAIVSDDVEDIQHAVRRWVDAGENGDNTHADLVVCTGGTGFGLRDVTPEAVAPLLDRQTPGLTQALMQHSLGKTPLAALSRLTTGIRNGRRNISTVGTTSTNDHGSLIVTLPGSSKAVQECFEVLLGSDGLLLHALELLHGGSGQIKHMEMQAGQHRGILTGTETDTGRSRGGCVHHGHGHGHSHAHHAPTPRTAQSEAGYLTHDPSTSLTTRKRMSPYPIVAMDEAINLIQQTTKTNGAISLPISADLRGYLLAESVRAPRSLPPKPTTNVDGYAIKADNTPPGAYKVETRGGQLTPGHIYRINTGQGLPEGADAVLMVEDSGLLEEKDGEEVLVEVKAQIDVGENVRKAGSDVSQGQEVLAQGVRLSDIGGEIGTLAFLGCQSVSVVRKPRIAILSTGNELHDVGSGEASIDTRTPSKDAWEFCVFDANRPSLSAALRGMGYEVVDLGIVGDDVDSTLSALTRGIEEADVLISTGGTSMGESDLLKPLIERRLRGGRIHFGRVAMKPGKVRSVACVR